MSDHALQVALADFEPTPPPPCAPASAAKRIAFWLPGPRFTYREKRKTKEGRCPVPKGRGKQARVVPGKGFAVVTEHPATKAAQKALVAALLPLAPPVPWEGPLRMDVDFVFVPPASPAWRYEAALAGAVYCTSDALGDRDNLHKLLADSMQEAGFYALDSRIVEGDVRKRWGVEPGYQVELRELREVESFAEWKARA